MNLRKALKGRAIVIPVAILATLAMLAFNEATYQLSRQNMDTLVAMGATRLTIATIMETLISTESSQRGYVLTGNENMLKPVDADNLRIEKGFESLALLHSKDAKFMAVLADFRLKVSENLSKANQAVQLRRSGRPEEAVELTLQRMGTADLVHTLDSELLAIETEGRLQRRVSIYQTLMFARVGVALLSLLSLLAILLYLRRASQLRNHQQDLKVIERTFRDKLETEVAEGTAELTNLTRYLLSAREDERARLARNLHDDLGALLTAAKLDAARIKPRLADASPETRELLAHLVTTLNSSVKLGRDIIENLRPSALTNLGLSATLEILARESAEASGVDIQSDFEPVPLSADVELTAYRLVQEALTNAAKYAKASQIRIKLAQVAGWAQISVQDNGVGFDPNNKPGTSYGLLGMRFRVETSGGNLTVTSAPSQGTLVLATLPLLPASEACQPSPTWPASIG